MGGSSFLELGAGGAGGFLLPPGFLGGSGAAGGERCIALPASRPLAPRLPVAMNWQGALPGATWPGLVCAK